MRPRKPISAACTLVYSETYSDKEPNYYVCFQVEFAEENRKGILKIRTDSTNKKAIESKLEIFSSSSIKEFEPWQENTWQNALFDSWIRFISMNAYCAAITRELIYELHELQDGTYNYELTEQSKKTARALYPHLIIDNEDRTESTLIEQTEVEITPQPYSSTPGTTDIEKEHTLDSLFDHIDYKIVSGFMMALGAVAIALAFTVLHAASLGTAGIVTASLGFASALSGIGFFTTGYTDETKTLNWDRTQRNMYPF
ncbi:hypothetical protein [Legionella quateirensis]|uniref:Uncharacterized protein n=1 Tax=Legionella quateirensis TaxID=45072 RepID=A0A378KTT5_9GAMM|nr:hypothetical protein [Legionella quateirensis]KTD54717.1 hypothetical protein Lqua_0224 [Legionella quateirensis]STY16897.1 Uncharacterised protein [Legionella quateirensis]